jgi:hypothetical protein
MDPKGKGMVINDKEETLYVDEPKDDKPTDSGSSHKKRDGKTKEVHKEDHLLRQRRLLLFTKG